MKEFMKMWFVCCCKYLLLLLCILFIGIGCEHGAGCILFGGLCGILFFLFPKSKEEVKKDDQKKRLQEQAEEKHRYQWSLREQMRQANQECIQIKQEYINQVVGATEDQMQSKLSWIGKQLVVAQAKRQFEYHVESQQKLEIVAKILLGK